jgi:DNA-binding transcriptional ArsR family regulator
MDQLFRALDDATRRGILDLLRKGDLAAGEIADRFRISKPSISHHLDLLKQADLVLAEKRGQYVIYSLNTSVLDECLAWLLELKKKKGASHENAEKRMATIVDPRRPVLRRRPALG